ncbi:MAG: hypothetical protein WBE91_11930 [Steroidobacteraceae bacterium]
MNSKAEQLEERLDGLLDALEQELTEATDEEILAAASDLGMNPAMKGSAAFFGVTVDLRTKTQQGYLSPSSDTLGTRRRLKDDPSSRS